MKSSHSTPPPLAIHSRRVQTYGAWVFFYRVYLHSNKYIFIWVGMYVCMHARSIYHAMCMYLLYYVINNLVLAFNRSSIYSLKANVAYGQVVALLLKAYFFTGYRKCKSCPQNVFCCVCMSVCSNFPRFAWKPSALISTNSTHTHTRQRETEREREREKKILRKQKKMRGTNFKRESLTADCWEREREREEHIRMRRTYTCT